MNTTALLEHDCEEEPHPTSDGDNQSDASSETTGSVFTAYEETSSTLFDQERRVTSRSSYGSDDPTIGEMTSSEGVVGHRSQQSRRESEGYQSMVATPVPRGRDSVEFHFPPVQENNSESLGSDMDQEKVCFYFQASAAGQQVKDH